MVFSAPQLCVPNVVGPFYITWQHLVQWDTHPPSWDLTHGRFCDTFELYVSL